MTTAPTPDLLPCPFCGGPVRVLFKRVSNRRSGHFAECRDCEARQGQPQPSRDAAVDNWNRRAELEARKPLPLSDEQIDAIADGMPGGLGGFMKTWGWRQFARKILDLRAPPTWEPGFDCMVPGQEELVMQFCLEIAGPLGKPGRNPDPVRLLEMAQELYKAEADARPKET